MPITQIVAVMFLIITILIYVAMENCHHEVLIHHVVVMILTIPIATFVAVEKFCHTMAAVYHVVKLIHITPILTYVAVELYSLVAMIYIAAVGIHTIQAFSCVAVEQWHHKVAYAVVSFLITVVLTYVVVEKLA